MAIDAPSHILNAITAAVWTRDGKGLGDEVRFTCPLPGHEDAHPSARWNLPKAVWYCDVCAAGGGWRDLAPLLGIALPAGTRSRGPSRSGGSGLTGGGGGAASAGKRIEHSNTQNATMRRSTAGPGFALDEYAKAKMLSIATLQGFGLSNVWLENGPAVRIPYRNPDGTEAAVRFRIAQEKGSGLDTRFRWKSGSKPLLYGLERLSDIRAEGFVVLVEGESDAHALWTFSIPCLGLPGAGTWNEQRDAAHLDDLPVIYVMREPDQGGDAMLAWLAKSRIRERARIVEIPGFKDPSALYLDDPDRFQARFQAALAAARPWTELAHAAAQQEATEAYQAAAALLHDPALLGRIGEVMQARGYAGDVRPAQLVYVAATSRLLERPQNVAVVSPSAAGKNATVDAALELIPPEVLHIVTAGSPRALIYTESTFEHKVVVFEEADSIPEEGPAASAIRSLAANSVLAYDVTEKNPETGRFETRHVRKPGPTGLITTSTRSLGEQMGTRVLEVAVSDAPEQTRAVMHAHARRVQPALAPPPDVVPYLALQRWLATAGERRVMIPFAELLADLVPATAVRMRRDFRQLLTCIAAVAVLSQCQRQRTAEGWIVATIDDDYRMARELLAPVFDTIAAAGVTPASRATVEAVPEDDEISLTQLAEKLGLQKSSTSYRVKRAIEGGWLVNNEPRRGHEAQLARGALLPEVTSALPDPAVVRDLFECSTANPRASDPPPPSGAGSCSAGAADALRAILDDSEVL
jgi:hypothetical protein